MSIELVDPLILSNCADLKSSPAERARDAASLATRPTGRRRVVCTSLERCRAISSRSLAWDVSSLSRGCTQDWTYPTAVSVESR